MTAVFTNFGVINPLLIGNFMKKRLLVAALSSALVLTACAKDKEAADGKPVKSTVVNEKSTDAQKLSYIIGYEQGLSIKQQAEATHEELDIEVLGKAIADAYNGKESAMTDDEVTAFGKAYQERKIKEAEEKAVKNKAEGEKFLAENAKKEGVQTTASGLQYKVITAGAGASPKATDAVVVHYEGKLIDGKVFDSSYERGVPAQLVLNQVIKGWTEGVQLMKPGAKYEFYIPSELAYGEHGSGNIEPNSVLIFTVELLNESQIKKAQEDAEKMMQEQMKAIEAGQAQQTQSAQEADNKK